VSGNKEHRIRKILERGLRTCDGYVVKMSPAYPPAGTTFPPHRYFNEDVLRAKFHSEADFHSQNKTRKDGDHVAADTANDESTAPDCGDSDLFFDFDIGSPEQVTILSVAKVIYVHTDKAYFGQTYICKI
jgi:hypothetical protein